MHHVGLLNLLGNPRDKGLRGETLRWLRSSAIDLTHHDVLAPMHIDPELDHSVRLSTR
jgi:hypothetical protein